MLNPKWPNPHFWPIFGPFLKTHQSSQYQIVKYVLIIIATQPILHNRQSKGKQIHSGYFFTFYSFRPLLFFHLRLHFHKTLTRLKAPGYRTGSSHAIPHSHIKAIDYPKSTIFTNFLHVYFLSIDSTALVFFYTFFEMIFL